MPGYLYRTVLNTTPKFVPTNPLSPNVIGAKFVEGQHLVEAVVVDVIFNEDHPAYQKDGYNVGCVQIRLLKTDFFRADSDLNWAYPLETNFTEYPLKNEIVLVQRALNRLYYSRKINLGNKPTHQAFFGLQDEMKPIPSSKTTLTNFKQSVAVPLKPTKQSSELGKYFTESNVQRLRHWEGDLTIEGRSGHSIRFGTAWKDSKVHKGHFKATDSNQAPNLLVRIGQWKDAPQTADGNYGLVVEDINKDKSSLWMVTDQIIPLEYSTKDSKVHAKSIPDFPTKLDKNQIVINTDRLVFNTKTNKMLFHSSNGFHVTSLKNITFDTETDYVSWIGGNRKINIEQNELRNVGQNRNIWVGQNSTTRAGQNVNIVAGNNVTLFGNSVSIVGGKTYLGSKNNSSQPVVLGETLRLLLIEFINAHLANSGTHVITAMGPGALNPSITSVLSKLLAELQGKTILSRDNFVNRNNDSPASVGSKNSID